MITHLLVKVEVVSPKLWVLPLTSSQIEKYNYIKKKRDEIKKKIGDWIVNQSTQEILNILEPADIWCAEVLDWENMLKHEGFKILDMTQRIKSLDGLDIKTLRCPIRVDGEIFKSDLAAPKVGQDNEKIIKEMEL